MFRKMPEMNGEEDEDHHSGKEPEHVEDDEQRAEEADVFLHRARLWRRL